MKLENIFKRFVSLAPKVYGGVSIENKEIIKVKGLKSNVNLTVKDLKLALALNYELKLNHI
jgi:hypothetical protein